ncbi:aldehyde dehydrogenase family protein [Auraticoccus sp. F435]|uniref:Aldehyde dehydrogenase family protein n=1 Tax=Auraticoccus cholistanensis TaxID=2656650 RepID=A0A6A9V1A7_9ACTN|nr:aldehyde dehydrogenase (NADP(+)) [Auraticoccus cholistanensis]MVA77079.1 aldehyde dehydrogenase family protein [Auraticoccus cholistanensis]
MTMITATNPYTGAPLEPVVEETSPEQVREVVARAAATFPWLSGLPRRERAALLEAMADALEGGREQIVATADSETGLGETRLNGELTRTIYQLRFFGSVITEGSYLEVTIDPPGDTPMGPRPDLRRMLVPIGVVAVFGASNFPLAFSVPGGDTASALAAGCPVVVKSHPSHPATSVLCHDLMVAAAREKGAPEGVFGMVHGQQAGIALVQAPEVTAVGFTGSTQGGRALLEAIAERDAPIPFYGELSSINPVVVTRSAAAERGQEVGEGLAVAVTGSAGQLCTKPGLVLVPTGAEGDAVVEAMGRAMGSATTVPLLNSRILDSYRSFTEAYASTPGVQQVARGEASGEGFSVGTALFQADAADLSGDDIKEIFGPASLVVRWSTTEELERVLAAVEDSLTATVHTGSDEGGQLGELTTTLQAHAGRILFNAYPTGVAVSWAQHHGGPWPATNSLHTSVGATAIRRFLRPVVFQNAPQEVLPPELRDDATDVPRRVDGRLVLPS